MLIGVVAALLACFGYGTASALQGYGAREATTADAGDHGPSLRSTISAALTPAFIAGMALDVIGFAGSLVSARLIPLFLSQTIMSANLVVTAVLGTVLLGVRLHRRDWLAIGGVLLVWIAVKLMAPSGGHGEDGVDAGGIAFDGEWRVVALCGR